MNISETIAACAKAQAEICEHFGAGDVSFHVNDSGWWWADKHTLYYGPTSVDEDLERGEYYGGDVLFVVRKDSHSLIHYDNGCGDKLHMVVPSACEVTDPAQIEAIHDA